MREIKFRAWDKKYNKFFEPTYEAYKGNLEDLKISLDGRLSIREINRTIDESMFPDRFILTQYTGLKDKNGKEIYEGDVIKITGEIYWDENIRLNMEYKVEYLDDFGMYNGILINNKNMDAYSEECLEFDPDIIGKIEIIGNIYENSQLLTN